MCDQKEEESTLHIFFTCRFAARIWQLVMEWMDFQLIPTDSVENMLTSFANSFRGKAKEVWLMIWHGVVWHVWKARNRVIFKGDSPSQQEIFETLKFNILALG